MADLFRPMMSIPGMRTSRELYVGVDSSVVLRSMDAARAMVVMSRSVRSGESGQQLVERIRATDVRVTSPSWVGEPSASDLSGLVAEIEDFRPDALIAVGGGSVIDGVKLARLLAEQPDVVLALPAAQRIIPVRAAPMSARLVAVPTTAGTGSEVSSAAVVSIDGHKVPVVSTNMIADAAILDPRLLVGAPRRVMSGAMLDAVSHAVEGYVSTVRNPLMDAFAESALADLHRFGPRALGGDDLEALERVQLAALRAGWVQNHSLVGACHALSHSIGSRLGHGEANGLVLPHVIRLNAQLGPDASDRYGILSEMSGVGRDAEDLASWVESFGAISDPLPALGVDDWERLADTMQSDVAARTNPVPVDATYAARLVESVAGVANGS